MVGRGGPSGAAPPADLIATQEAQPTYAEIEAMLRDRPDSMVNKVGAYSSNIAGARG